MSIFWGADPEFEVALLADLRLEPVVNQALGAACAPEQDLKAQYDAWRSHGVPLVRMTMAEVETGRD